MVMAPRSPMPRIAYNGADGWPMIDVARRSRMVDDFHRTSGDTSAGGPNALDPDRITALEARIIEQERAEQDARPVALLSIAIVFGGIAFAAGAYIAIPAVMLVLSASCAFVLYGLNRKGLAAVNSLALVGMTLVQFVFMPALDEMSRRADEATINLVSTMVSGSEYSVVVSGPFVAPDDLLLFPTPVSADDFTIGPSASAPD
jgi:hypothetical protein